MKKINILYTLTAPVSHIGETASTGSYFQTIQTSNGRIPVITGNSVRGTLRDCAALHLMQFIKDPVDKEVFNVLFSGGNISGATKNDVERAKKIREHFPMVSLFGAGLGTMIMSGNLLSGFLYPVCIETENFTSIQSDISWHDCIDEIDFTRFDDTKKDSNLEYIADIDEEKKAKASTQMRFGVQYMAAGTQFAQEIILIDGTTDIEEGALYTAVKKWFEVPVLGGMKSKGFGKFTAESDEISVDENGVRLSENAENKIRLYEDFLKSDVPANWIDLLKAEVKKGGKTAD